MDIQTNLCFSRHSDQREVTLLGGKNNNLAVEYLEQKILLRLVDIAR